MKQEISTAEEFVAKNAAIHNDNHGASKVKLMKIVAIETLLIEFAKFHVKQALLEASEKAKVECIIEPNDQPSSSFGDDYSYVVDKQSILNSYDINKIK